MSELQALQDQLQRFASDYARLEIENANLANLYVASHQLHGTIEREMVLQAIQEITANLIGFEEMAVFETSEDGSSLELAASFGIDKHEYARVPIGERLIGRAVAEGSVYVSPTGSAGDEDLTAVVPLRIDDQLVGAIAIFRLLSHKARINDIDREMFDLLSMHAATSLYCARLHRNARLGLVSES